MENFESRYNYVLESKNIHDVCTLIDDIKDYSLVIHKSLPGNVELEIKLNDLFSKCINLENLIHNSRDYEFPNEE